MNTDDWKGTWWAKEENLKEYKENLREKKRLEFTVSWPVKFLDGQFDSLLTLLWLLKLMVLLALLHNTSVTTTKSWNSSGVTQFNSVGFQLFINILYLSPSITFSFSIQRIIMSFAPIHTINNPKPTKPSMISISTFHKHLKITSKSWIISSLLQFLSLLQYSLSSTCT